MLELSLAVLWLAATSGCGGTAVVPDDAPDDVATGGDDAATCGWSASRDVAVVNDARLTEISGMAASHRDPGILYVHNDSGETVARYFAIDLSGAVRAEIVVDGAPSFDTEDVALEVDGDREWIWLGDVGDKAARDGGTPRAFIEVARAEVPPLPEDGETVHVAEHELFRFTYPDAPHDCEALIFDPPTGDLYLISKENEGPHVVFRASAPHVDGTTRALERVAEILPGRSLADAITAADADRRGRFVVRTYRRVFLFGAPVTTPFARWASAPTELPMIREFQGEALAFSHDARTLYSIAEGEAETLHALDDGCAP